MLYGGNRKQGSRSLPKVRWRTFPGGGEHVISEGYVCEKICGTREWVSIRVLGYMYVMYIREYIYYLVSLVFSSLF